MKILKPYFVSFKQIVNCVSCAFTILGIVLSIAIWKITPDTEINIIWLFISILFSLMVILLLFAHSLFFFVRYHERYNENNLLPKVININMTNERIIVFATRSRYFLKDIDITVCVLDDDEMEAVLCYGRVVHVQEKALQLEIFIEGSNFNSLDLLHSKIISINKNQLKILPGRVSI